MALEEQVRHPYGSPYPSTGSLVNGAALLRMFGQNIVLEDASNIRGIFRAMPRFDGLGAATPNQNRMDYRLFVPENRKGTLAKEQKVYIPGTARVWRVLNETYNGDGWNTYTITYDNQATQERGL